MAIHLDVPIGRSDDLETPESQRLRIIMVLAVHGPMATDDIAWEISSTLSQADFENWLAILKKGGILEENDNSPEPNTWAIRPGTMLSVYIKKP